MKLPVLTLLIACAAWTTASAGDMEIRNGDFEKGKQFWRGGGKVVTSKEGSKVLELKASERYGDEATQDIDMGKNTSCEITLRMRSEGFTGDGLRIAMQRPSGGSTFNVRKLFSDGAWTELKWTFNRNGPDEKFTLVISPTIGKGSIQIDDVKVSSTAGKSPNL